MNIKDDGIRERENYCKKIINKNKIFLNKTKMKNVRKTLKCIFF